MVSISCNEQKKLKTSLNFWVKHLIAGYNIFASKTGFHEDASIFSQHLPLPIITIVNERLSITMADSKNKEIHRVYLHLYENRPPH